MENEQVKGIIEAILFVSGKPVTIKKLQYVFGIDLHTIEDKLAELITEYENRPNNGLTIIEIAGGFQMVTRKDHAPWLKRLYGTKKIKRLSNAALEVLAIVAYKQPITRSEIDEVRGVNSSGISKALLETELIKIVGRKEVIGRPLLYGSTEDFLEYFGLRSLDDLPDLSEIEELIDKKTLLKEMEKAGLSLDGSAPTGDVVIVDEDGNETDLVQKSQMTEDGQFSRCPTKRLRRLKSLAKKQLK